MSYILDALKKAERERGSTRTPALAGAHEDRTLNRGRMAIIGGGFLILAVAAFIFFRPDLTAIFHTSPGPVERDRASTKPDAGQIHQPDGAAPSLAESPDSAAPEKSARPPARVTTAVQPSAAAAQNSREGGQSASPIRPVPSHEISEPAVAGIAEPAEQSGTNPESAAQKEPQPAPGVAEAAAILEEAVARMNLNILLYEEAEADRRVFINGKKYMKGDLVEGKYLIESITQDGALLSYEGARALLRLH